jgi:hypothetical protein
LTKEKDMIIYSIYKKNHPVAPKDVANVLSLIFKVEKDFSEQTSSFHRY